MADEKKPEGEKPAEKKPEVVEPAGAKPSDDDTKAHIHRLNEEAKNSRLELKAAKEQLAAVTPIVDALKNVFGAKGEDEVAKKVNEAKQTGEAEKREILLQAKVEALAARSGAHDEEDVRRAMGDLADVQVDVAKRHVDTAAIEKRIGELKKAKPWLFKQDGGAAPEPKGSPAPNRPNLGGGATAYEQWQAMLNDGKTSTRDAAVFYNQHKAEIDPRLPKR